RGKRAAMNRHMKRLLQALALIVFVGCRNVSPTGEGVSLRTACSLLTRSTVQQLVGRTIRPGDSSSNLGLANCVFHTIDGKTLIGVRTTTGLSAESIYRSIVSPTDTPVVVPGAEARWNAPLDAVHALKGRTLFLAVQVID